MIGRAAIVEEARTWLGTPFQHQARLKGVGVDCLGLIGEVGAALKLPGTEAWRTSEEFRGYGPTPRPDLLLAACERYLDRIALASVGLGDILLMAFKVFPQHFAIVSRVAPTYVIHAYPLGAVDRVTENGVAVAGAKVVRAYRYRGVMP